MKLYEELWADINENADAEYAAFHKRLLKNENIKVVGVRVPVMRKLAKKYLDRFEELLSLPDECYEITFIKLQAAALLPYERFVAVVGDCVKLIDNWATCDCFVPKCLTKRKGEFLPYINAFASSDKEFTQRFALTTLLHFYVSEEYLNLIFTTVENAATQKYFYVHMAAAWLVAEVIVKFYEQGLDFLKLNKLDVKTHNKAIQKARESYRLTAQQKEYLKTLKR